MSRVSAHIQFLIALGLSSPKSLYNISKLYNNLHMLGAVLRLVCVFIILISNSKLQGKKSFLVKFK